MHLYPQVATPTDSAAQPGAGDFNYDAIFSWDRPGRSTVGMDNLYDGTGRANVIQFYYGPGGPPAPVQFNTASIKLYGEYWNQQSFPSEKLDAPVIALASQQLDLRANFKQTLTVNPASGRAPEPLIDYVLGDRVPVYASNKLRQALPPLPSPDTDPPILAWQRIYGIPIEIDDNGSETVRELLCGPVGPAPVIGGPAIAPARSPQTQPWASIAAGIRGRVQRGGVQAPRNG
jgi:hypothetical protein